VLQTETVAVLKCVMKKKRERNVPATQRFSTLQREHNSRGRRNNPKFKAKKKDREKEEREKKREKERETEREKERE